MAPEVKNNYAYNEKCDIWSLGSILYTLFTGMPPFKGDTVACKIIDKLKVNSAQQVQEI
jgi:serine/threonine protein kinase